MTKWIGCYLLKEWRFLTVALSGMFCLLAIEHYAWVAFGPGTWGPRFACCQTCFDCGKVSKGERVKREFTIKNTGRQPLSIQAIPSCGACLDIEGAKATIGPGETSGLKVILNVDKLEDGNFRKTILLSTNDEYLPKTIFCIQGEVVGKLPRPES